MPRVEWVVILGSLAALGLALISQYGYGFHPCELCIWQRWAYGAVVAVALLSLKFPKLKSLMVLAIFTVSGIAIFHFGIEQKWWEGFSSCSSSFKGALTIEELKAQIMGAPVTRCDEATWFLLGLSMAGWNVLYSGALGLYALKSLLIRRRAG